MNARLLLPALALILLASTRADAQRAPEPPLQFWIEAGLGGGVASRDGYGMSGHLDIRGLHDRMTYAVRVSATSGGPTEYDTFLSWGAIADEFFEGAALIGVAPTRVSGGGFVFEAGPALVWGNRVRPNDEPCSFLCSDFKRVDFGPVLGLSLGVGAEGSVWPALGYSVRLHANLNAEQPFAGLTLGARLGKVR